MHEKLNAWKKENKKTKACVKVLLNKILMSLRLLWRSEFGFSIYRDKGLSSYHRFLKLLCLPLFNTISPTPMDTFCPWQNSEVRTYTDGNCVDVVNTGIFWAIGDILFLQKVCLLSLQKNAYENIYMYANDWKPYWRCFFSSE